MNPRNLLLTALCQLYESGYTTRVLDLDSFVRGNNLDYSEIEKACAELKAERSIVNSPAASHHTFIMTGSGYAKHHHTVEAAKLLG